jgi:hypothetical protein
MLLTLPGLDAALFGAHAMDPEDELNRLFSRSHTRIEDALSFMVATVAYGNPEEYAVEQLAAAVGGTMTLADLMGRRRLLLEADAADEGPTTHGSDIASPTPHVRLSSPERLSPRPSYTRTLLAPV